KGGYHNLNFVARGKKVRHFLSTCLMWLCYNSFHHSKAVLANLVTCEVSSFLDSSLPAAVRKGFCVSCGLCRLRRQSPQLTRRCMSRRLGQAALNSYKNL